MADRAAAPDPIDRAPAELPTGTPTTPRGEPHPANALNELSGEEWLYFTKSIWSTAYPSELGHALRKAHGANKPPRLMARLIEFFTRTGELVLDPFAGVGGTLLGAAIAQGPRRALGIELDPRWVGDLPTWSATLSAERDGAARSSPTSARAIRAGSRTFDPSGCEMRLGDALAAPADAGRRLGRLRRDGPALQPPAAAHDGRRPAGGDARQPADRLRDGHRRSGRLRQQRRLPDVPGPDGARPRGVPAGPAARAVCHGHRPRRVPGRPLPVHRSRPRGTGRARRASSPRAISIWYQAGTRLRPYGYPDAFVPNIAHQHILVLRRDR